MKRAPALLAAVLGAVLVHGPAFAQAGANAPTKPSLNWVFDLAVVTLLGFLAFIGFVTLYYTLAVVARNRRFATPAPVAVGVRAPVGAGVAAAPGPVAAPAPAPAAPAAAPAAPAAPAAAPPPAAPAATSAPAKPAATGGLPHIDPNNLPDGIDVVARGRLKKLAVFQERGQEPPADLIESLRPVLAQMGGGEAPAAAPAAATAPAPAPAAEAPAAEAPAEEAAAEAPAAEVAAPEPAPAEPAPAADAAAPAAAPTPAPASTGGLPHIDPNNLPSGIDAVTRGRLKKLAILQERGQEPPADLVESLKPVLDQMS